AIPPDPFVSGTFAGDVLLNSSIPPANADTLYHVALHELGHALGLAPSTDPRSVMFNTFTVTNNPTASDVAAIRALYGARPADANEGQQPNDTRKEATRIRYSDGSSDPAYDGSTPLVAYGDVTTRKDVDYFFLPNLLTYAGPLSVRLQTAGISLLAPKLTV